MSAARGRSPRGAKSGGGKRDGGKSRAGNRRGGSAGGKSRGAKSGGSQSRGAKASGAKSRGAKQGGGGAGPRSASPRRLKEPTVCVLAERGRLLAAEPLFERIRAGAGGERRIALDSRGRADARAGDLVLVGQGKHGPRVVRKLGRPDVARDVLEGLMLDRGLQRTFTDAVESEAVAVAASPAKTRGRRDLTALPTFTIDPHGARDHDDAISAAAEGDSARVWVHIADVSAYVRPGGKVEQEALRRATSTYVPGAVEPMLPPALSNEACSLTPGDDRLAVTVELEMRGADVRSASFYRSTVRSDARLTYPEIDEVFAGSKRAEEPWGGPLVVAREVATALAERHAERHALEINSAEPSYEFDDAGHVTGVAHEHQTESHRVIEHLMILANEQVAGYLSERKLPALYRVHEQPDPASVEFMVSQLASLDVPTPPVPKNMSPQQAADIAADASRMIARYKEQRGGAGAAIASLVLRSLKQASYLPKNLGHAGLASTSYCHFTSPIRRYPDLVVHRALLAGLGLDVVAPRAHELDEIAVATSDAERAAMKIERGADDVCSAFLLERRLAEAGEGEQPAFDGEVAGVIAQGAFISFGDERFEGFLPVRRLSGWWELNPEETMLRCEDSGEALRFGDPVRVAVDGVDAPRGRVDLVRPG